MADLNQKTQEWATAIIQHAIQRVLNLAPLSHCVVLVYDGQTGKSCVVATITDAPLLKNILTAAAVDCCSRPPDIECVSVDPNSSGQEGVNR